MTAKKRWINKLYPDSQESYNVEEISWSSSESDEDIQKNGNKCTNVNQCKWITTGIIRQADEQTFHPKIETNTPLCSSKSNVFKIWDINDSSPENKENNRKVSSLQRSCESPITNDSKLETLSPVLVQISDDFYVSEDTSPVLGSKRRALHKIRNKYKGIHSIKKVKVKHDFSPDLFETQSSQIIDSESPEKFQTSVCIDPFPSQHSSEITTTDTGSSSSIKTVFLYHQPPKRKNYKKGGLAALLQKTLHIQRTRFSIWQHEMYTKKSDQSIDFEGEVIDFVVKNKWKEYGNILLECNLWQENNLESSRNIEHVNFFIIIIGFSANLNLLCNTNCDYKLFPPYNVKTVNYKSHKVPCYFNVTKLVPLKKHL